METYKIATLCRNPETFPKILSWITTFMNNPKNEDLAHV